MRIADLQLDSPFWAAPLAGVSSAPWRLMARRCGAGLVCTEMVSTAGLLRRQPQSMKLLTSFAEERPLALQLFGSKPGEMLSAARRLRESPGLGVDLLDINMGCPVRKVRRQGAGSALLSDPILAAELVAAAAEGWGSPLTVKVRLGESGDDLEKIVPGLLRAGAQAITLHARTVRQGFAGQADWTAIERLKSWCPVPVIGNGDVNSAADALGMLAQTGCDGVMIGRGALGNPWIFAQANDLLAGRQPGQVSLPERRRVLLQQWELARALARPYQEMHYLRQSVMFYVRGLPGAPSLRAAAGPLRDPLKLKALVEDFFADLGVGPAEEEAQP